MLLTAANARRSLSALRWGESDERWSAFGAAARAERVSEPEEPAVAPAGDELRASAREFAQERVDGAHDEGREQREQHAPEPAQYEQTACPEQRVRQQTEGDRT